MQERPTRECSEGKYVLEAELPAGLGGQGVVHVIFGSNAGRGRPRSGKDHVET